MALSIKSQNPASLYLGGNVATLRLHHCHLKDAEKAVAEVVYR